MRTQRPHSRPSLRTVRWAAHATLAVFVAAACGTNSEPAGPTSVLVDPGSAFAAVQGAANNARCRVASSGIWRGLNLAPAGRASLGIGDDVNPVQVSNIGSSGNDGVCLSFPGGATALGMEFQAPVGGGGMNAVRGQFGDGNGGGFSEELSIQRGPKGTIQRFHGPSGGDLPVEEVSWFLGGVEVATGIIAFDRNGTAVLGDFQKPGGGGTGQIVRYNWDCDYDGVVRASFRFDASYRIRTTLPGAPMVTADEIQLTRDLPAPIVLRSAISRFVGAAGPRQLMELVSAVSAS